MTDVVLRQAELTSAAGAVRPSRARCQRLQSLEDAIAYRQARIAAPCPYCEPGPGGRRCDDHACDLMLITDYEQAAVAIIRGMPGPAPLLVTP